MQKSIQELAPRISDCLKVIYAMQERGLKVTTSAVHEQLGVSDATGHSATRPDLLPPLREQVAG